MPNIVLYKKSDVSVFRRIAAVAWDAPRDPTILGTMQFPAEALEAWIKQKREETGEKITVTHVVARAAAVVLNRHPDLNSMIRLGRLYHRRDVDVFVQVAIEREKKDGEGVAKTDLSGVVIRKADGKDIGQIAQEIRTGAGKIRSGQDEDFKKVKRQGEVIPPLLFRFILKGLEFLQYTLNISPKLLGAPRDPFGSVMVTSLGSRGIKVAYAPFFPQARCPIIILVGAIDDAAAVVDGQVVVQRQLTLSGTFDHRVLDGLHCSVFAVEMHKIFADPSQLDEVLTPRG
jgi:pyruvate dehydrogenase E2 component (dihydrolipoamide acetyltransferase)